MLFEPIEHIDENPEPTPAPRDCGTGSLNDDTEDDDDEIDSETDGSPEEDEERETRSAPKPLEAGACTQLPPDWARLHEELTPELVGRKFETSRGGLSYADHLNQALLELIAEERTGKFPNRSHDELKAEALTRTRRRLHAYGERMRHNIPFEPELHASPLPDFLLEFGTRAEHEAYLIALLEDLESVPRAQAVTRHVLMGEIDWKDNVALAERLKCRPRDISNAKKRIKTCARHTARRLRSTPFSEGKPK